MSVVSSAFRRRSVAGSCVGDDSLLGDTQSSAGGGESEKIHVSIRLRPLNEKETLKNEVSDWECISSSTLIFKSSMPDRSMSSTKQVYEEVAKEVALSVLSGVNASIFAYGQTSSGKTYTVSGITEHAMADIFDYIHQNKEREFVLKFSALEIYNEAVRDLLSSDPSPLRLLDDPERGTIVDKLIEEDIENWDHLQELLSICEGKPEFYLSLTVMKWFILLQSQELNLIVIGTVLQLKGT
ncbi:Kinesin-like protein KIN-7H [Linum perenne]